MSYDDETSCEESVYSDIAGRSKYDDVDDSNDELSIDEEEQLLLGTQTHGDDCDDGDGGKGEGEPQRWIMLFYMCALNLLSEWSCFSLAPIASFMEELYGTEDPEQFVVVCLYANACATTIQPYLVYRFGLRGAVIIGASLLCVGSIIKSTMFPEETWKLYIAFFCIGLSQPFYQCTPAVLSVNWFPPSERTMATAAAINSDQLGIGVAFIAGTMIIKDAHYVGYYFDVMMGLSILFLAGVLIQFEEKPPVHEDEEKENLDEQKPLTPYSDEAACTMEEPQKHKAEPEHLEMTPEEGNFFWLLKNCFSQHGFSHALCAFVVSAIVINTCSTFMSYFIRVQKGSTRASVGVIGALFEVLVMVSSLVIGKKTDQSHAYYTIVMFLLVAGAFSLAQCAISLDSQALSLRWALIATAIFIGPLQPIATEIGCEVAYPIGENGVLCIQELTANLCSAIFIPFFQKMGSVGSDRYGVKYTYSFYLLVVIFAVATLLFSTYHSRYKRHDAHHDSDEDTNEETQEEDSLDGGMVVLLDKEGVPLLSQPVQLYT